MGGGKRTRDYLEEDFGGEGVHLRVERGIGMLGEWEVVLWSMLMLASEIDRRAEGAFREILEVYHCIAWIPTPCPALQNELETFGTSSN